jgi:hypothetical protein
MVIKLLLQTLDVREELDRAAGTEARAALIRTRWCDPYCRSSKTATTPSELVSRLFGNINNLRCTNGRHCRSAVAKINAACLWCKYTSPTSLQSLHFALTLSKWSPLQWKDVAAVVARIGFWL